MSYRDQGLLNLHRISIGFQPEISDVSFGVFNQPRPNFTKVNSPEGPELVRLQNVPQVPSIISVAESRLVVRAALYGDGENTLRYIARRRVFPFYLLSMRPSAHQTPPLLSLMRFRCAW